MPSARNRPSLEDIRSLPIGEIAALPPAHLALLQEDAETALATAKTLKEWLDGAIALRYADRAARLRREPPIPFAEVLHEQWRNSDRSRL